MTGSHEEVIYIPMAVIACKVHTNPMVRENVKHVTVTVQNNAGVTDAAEVPPGGEFNFLVEPGEWLVSASITGAASEYREIFLCNGDQKDVLFHFGAAESTCQESTEEIQEVLESVTSVVAGAIGEIVEAVSSEMTAEKEKEKEAKAEIPPQECAETPKEEKTETPAPEAVESKPEAGETPAAANEKPADEKEQGQ